MKDNRIGSILIRVLETLLVALLYFGTARISQTLGIQPANITPVWLPSGIMLTLALIRGYSILPGVFLGAFFGGVWPHWGTDVPGGVLTLLFTGSFNGIGDVLCVFVSAHFIKRRTSPQFIFRNIDNVTTFLIFGAIIGPAISAVFGVTSNCIAGFVGVDEYLYTLTTWWIGVGVGVLTLTPVMLVWYSERQRPLKLNMQALGFTMLLLVGALYMLGIVFANFSVQLPLYIFAPLLLWCVFILNIRLTFTYLLVIAVVSVILTAFKMGPFMTLYSNDALINLQLFLAVLMITVLYVQATVGQLRQVDLTKGLLLKEIHHRVKNNLQIISGLLMLQSGADQDEKTKTMLADSQHRISSMAIIHEMLYQSENLLKINIHDYLDQLVKYLVESIIGKENDIQFSLHIYDVEDIHLTIDTAIPLGLLVTEIVTNSLKHGLESNGEDVIYIHIENEGSNNYRLRIGDNGKGFPLDASLSNTGSLGTKLIQALSEQLHGEIMRDKSRKGTHYVLSFSESIREMPST